MNKKNIFGLGLAMVLSCTSFAIDQSLSDQEQSELEKARTALVQNQYERALELLEPLYEGYPQDTEIANNFAVALFNTGRTTEAGIILQEHLQSHQEVGVASNNLFHVYDYLAAESYSMLSGGKPALPQLSLASSDIPKNTPTPYKPEPTPVLSQPSEEINSQAEEIAKRLQGYVSAWSNGNANAYLSYYFPNRSPIRGQGFDSWKEERTSKIFPERDISVATDGLQIMSIDESQAIAVFKQSYSARNYSDETTKQLTWLKQNGEWFIRYEIALPN